MSERKEIDLGNKVIIQERRPNGTLRVATRLKEGRGRTQQQFKEQCDINNILKHHMKHGIPLPPITGIYGDFSKTLDYQQSIATITKAQNSFDSLPAKLRKRFDNDPAQLIAFCNDPNNLEEAIELGIAVKPSTPNANDDLTTNANSKKKTKQATPPTPPQSTSEEPSDS